MCISVVFGIWISGKDTHFSTIGKNYERPFKETDLFEEIFERVLTEAIECGFICADAIFIDATHVKPMPTRRSISKRSLNNGCNKAKRICWKKSI